MCERPNIWTSQHFGIFLRRSTIRRYLWSGVPNSGCGRCDASCAKHDSTRFADATMVHSLDGCVSQKTAKDKINIFYFTYLLSISCSRGEKAKNVPGGALTLGNFDTEHCSQSCNWVPLSSATYYQFRLQG